MRSRMATSSVLQCPAEDIHFAGSGAVEAFQNLDGGRLARAVGAEQTEALAMLDLQVDALHGMDRAVSPRVLLAQVLDANRPFTHALVASLAHDTETCCAFRLAGESGLDHRPIRQGGGLGNHNHAVANHVRGVVFGLERFRVH